MRKKLILLFMIVIIILVFRLYFSSNEPVSTDLAEYYKSNSIADTGAHNVVTAIYLNYRIYDTLFETLILLVSIMAIIYFSRHESEDIEL